MRITDEKIIESFNIAAQAGHPDPAGFIARADIKTGLDFDGEYKGAVGAFGVDRKQALKAGFTDDELATTDGNFAAAIAVDMNNYRASGDDLDEMYRKGNPGSKKGTDRFIFKLAKEREKLTNKFVFEEGQLKSFRQSETEGDTTDSFSVSRGKEKVVYKESRRLKTPDDIKRQTNTFEFRSADKQRVDDLMQKLVHTIIDEKPINAV